MNKRVRLGAAAMLLAVLSLSLAFRRAPGPELKQKLAAARMTLAVPPGWVETPVIANDDMEYDYALRYPGRRLELRYAVRPLAGLLAEYRASQKKKNVTMVDPNKFYPSLFRAIYLNIGPAPQAGQDQGQQLAAEFARALKEFPAAAVKAEFGADWGATDVLQPRASFGQEYKYCMLVGLHRNNAADAYCFYLFDEQDDLKEVVFNDPAKAAFHSLRFQ